MGLSRCTFFLNLCLLLIARNFEDYYYWIIFNFEQRCAKILISPLSSFSFDRKSNLEPSPRLLIPFQSPPWRSQIAKKRSNFPPLFDWSNSIEFGRTCTGAEYIPLPRRITASFRAREFGNEQLPRVSGEFSVIGVLNGREKGRRRSLIASNTNTLRANVRINYLLPAQFKTGPLKNSN